MCDIDSIPSIHQTKMAASSTGLSARDISRVTDIILADHRFRFSVEYLGINRIEYKSIEAEAKFIHHDTLFEGISRWKVKVETEGQDAKDELVKILRQIRKEHGWFTHDDVAFLSDITGSQISESSKLYSAHKN